MVQITVGQILLQMGPGGVIQPPNALRQMAGPDLENPVPTRTVRSRRSTVNVAKGTLGYDRHPVLGCSPPARRLPLGAIVFASLTGGGGSAGL